MFLFHRQRCERNSEIVQVIRDIYIYIYRERERERERESKRGETDRQTGRQTDRQYNKVQACLGLKTFALHFRPF